jgi:hypothetical protein
VISKTSRGVEEKDIAIGG